MINLSKVSESLQELMNERGLTQGSLAEKLNTGRTKLSDILNEKNAPNYATLIKLVEFFNCSADFLLGLKDYPCEEIEYKPVIPFGERLKNIMQERHIGQSTLVNEAGISWSIIHGWLKGKTSPSMDNLVKTAAYFDCSVDALLGRI